ncbi:hypothetical protein D9756_003573 [Leucocoprinus leucothites]|uniref:Iron-sulfur clusters transporter ATM1, mitochondrial n=1 Tax=Leucocoprinus leucothites TaxID=201217 RepID=A0A8H5G7A4_9AGAR|nr:hypothetical protein D9756_003573 [Leucoagaricus leucothites]
MQPPTSANGASRRASRGDLHCQEHKQPGARPVLDLVAALSTIATDSTLTLWPSCSRTNSPLKSAEKPKANPKQGSPKEEVQYPTKAEQRRNDWIIVKQLFADVWPKDDWRTRGTVLLGFVLLISAKLLNVQVPALYKSVIDSLNVDLASPPTARIIAGSMILRYGFACVGTALSDELLNAVFANVGQRAIRKVARETFERLNLDLKFHLTHQKGGLTRAIDRGTKEIAFLMQAISFRIAPTVLEISLVCGILAYKFGWDFAAITTIALAAFTWFTVRTTSWRTRFRREANQADNKAATVAVDSLINFEAAKIFNNEKYEVAQYDTHLHNYEKPSTKITTSLTFPNSGQNVIFTSALTGAMFLAAQGVVQGTMTIGDLVMVNQLIFQLSLPLNFLGTIHRELWQNLLDTETLGTLVNTNTLTADPPGPNAKPLALAKGGSIKFENESPDRLIFRGLNFEIPAGKRVATVGPSGCGKSTVFRLLFRFYHPSSGIITIKGQDISAIMLQSLRKSIGIVPQDTPLFHSTVLHSIRHGRLTTTDEEVMEVVKKANCYDTKVRERRLMISAGEKQPLVVARVLLKDPEILFFNEATSTLDAHTESEFLKSIHSPLLSPSHGKPRISIFIAHRLRTVVESDLIIVFKDGHVVEQGTHEELLVLDGLYRSMRVQQSSYGGEEAVVSETASEDGVPEEKKVKELEVVEEQMKA